MMNTLYQYNCTVHEPLKKNLNPYDMINKLMYYGGVAE